MEIETSISSCFYVYVCVSGACLVFGWFEGLLDWVTETHGVAATVCCLIPTPSRRSVCVYLVLKHPRQSLSISTIFTAKCAFSFSAPVVLHMFAYYNAWTKKTWSEMGNDGSGRHVCVNLNSKSKMLSWMNGEKMGQQNTFAPSNLCDRCFNWSLILLRFSPAFVCECSMAGLVFSIYVLYQQVVVVVVEVVKMGPLK